MMNESILQNFLKAQPMVGGAYEISPARGFQHDEGDYDRQYGVDRVEPETLRLEAGHLFGYLLAARLCGGRKCFGDRVRHGANFPWVGDAPGCGSPVHYRSVTGVLRNCTEKTCGCSGAGGEGGLWRNGG